MKTPDQLTADVRRRLAGRWHECLTGTDVAFPHAFAIGRPQAAELRAGYATVYACTVEWQDWARDHEVELRYENRVAAGGTRQTVPTHAIVNSVDHAATIAGEDWPERLVRGRKRLASVTSQFPAVADAGRLLRAVDTYSEVDFGLLLTVAAWFREDPGRSLRLTPRQVPIPGVHAKWLQSHLPAVCALSGLDNLGILPAHPQRIHFTYLDPSHRARGGRVHDSATVGDSFAPAYTPDVVVISENKDTAIHFPPLRRAISVEGVGRGGATPASFEWLRNARVVAYWGDIDADGYEILDGYRADFDRDIDSILMDPATYAAFERFGTDLDKNGRELGPRIPRPVDRLRADERAVYQSLVDTAHHDHRRVEQERIPLATALAALTRLAARPVERTPG